MHQSRLPSDSEWSLWSPKSNRSWFHLASDLPLERKTSMISPGLLSGLMRMVQWSKRAPRLCVSPPELPKALRIAPQSLLLMPESSLRLTTLRCCKFGGLSAMVVAPPSSARSSSALRSTLCSAARYPLMLLVMNAAAHPKKENR